MVELLHREISGAVIEDTIRVHKQLGPGLLESAYETCLAYLLNERGLAVQRQKPIPIAFEGVSLDGGFRADLIVDGKVLVELKAVESLEPIFEAQLMTYLRMSGIRVGLLLNFNVLRLRDGMKRIVI